MKKACVRLFFTLIVLGLTSCLDDEPKSSSSGSVTNSTVTDTNTVTNTTTTTTTNTSTTINPGSGSTCYGNTSDGQGSGTPIIDLDIVLAGQQNWLPGSGGGSSFLSIDQARMLFNTDSRLRLRLQIKSQPVATVGEEYCYGRIFPQPLDQYLYTKLKFRVHLRDVQCANEVNGNCLSYSLGARYKTQYIDPVGVDTCSPIVELGQLRNVSQYGTVIEIEDVRADSTCQANGTYCPADKAVRQSSCYHMKLQIVTDYTQDFK